MEWQGEEVCHLAKTKESVYESVYDDKSVLVRELLESSEEHSSDAV